MKVKTARQIYQHDVQSSGSTH